MKKIAISLLTCNDIDLAKKSIESLLDSDINKNKLKLFWWDNNSNYDLTDYVKELNVPIEIIVSKENDGIVIPRIKLFEKIKKENFDYLLEIHADMVFTEKWSEEVFKLDDGNTAIMMPTIINSKSRFSIEQIEEFSKKYKKDNIIECARQVHPWIIKLNLLESVGGYYYDIYAPMRLEDDDLVFRVLKNGYKIRATENSIVCHYGQSTRKSVGIRGTSNKIFFNKNGITINELIKKFDKHPVIKL